MGSVQSKKECIYYTKLTAAFLLLFIFTISEIEYVGNLISPVSELEESAYDLFYHVPSYIDSALIISNRHFQNTSKFNQTLYIDILTSTNITRQRPYMSTPRISNNFFEAVSNVYFVDACRYGEDWLIAKGFTLEDCMNTS